jgi:hypothetical protein
MAGLNHESWNFTAWVCGLIMGALIASSHTLLTDRRLFLVEILLLIVSGFLLTIVRPERPWERGLAIWLGYFVISEIREIYVSLHPSPSANYPIPAAIWFVLVAPLFALSGAGAFLGAWIGHLLRNFLNWFDGPP